MKVIVRATDTGLYLAGPGTWAHRQGQAMEFDNSIAALEFCVAQQLYDVEILLFLGNQPLDLPIRLFPRAMTGGACAPPSRLCASSEV